MDSSKLNDWMQVIGIFAVVGSLIFVGLQMQQDRRIAELATYQERAIASANFTIDVFSNEHYWKVRTIAEASQPLPLVEYEGWASSIPLKDVQRAARIFSGVLFLFDNSHYQFQQGFLPEEHWNRTRSTLKTAISSPFEKWVVQQMLESQRPAFRAELAEILDEIEREKH